MSCKNLSAECPPTIRQLLYLVSNTMPCHAVLLLCSNFRTAIPSQVSSNLNCIIATLRCCDKVCVRHTNECKHLETVRYLIKIAFSDIFRSAPFRPKNLPTMELSSSGVGAREREIPNQYRTVAYRVTAFGAVIAYKSYHFLHKLLPQLDGVP